jgi:hypothetical protein
MTLVAAVLAALAVSAVSIATGGDDEPAAERPARASTAGLLAAGGGGAAAGLPDPHAILAGLAARLDVSEAELRDAVQAVSRTLPEDELERAVQDGRITEAERDLLVRCAEERAGCDRAEVRALAERLRGEVERDGLGALGLTGVKDRGLAALGGELDRSAGDVEAAVQAELEETLDGLVTSGLITEDARTLAVDCFEDPDSCHVRELEAELPLLQGLGAGLGHRD